MVKNLPANRENAGSIPGSERSSGGGNGNPLQNSYLENSMDRRIWQVPWDHKELDTTEHVRASTHTHTHTSLLKAYVTSLRGLTQVIYIHKKKYLQTSATLLDLKHNSEVQSYICIFTKRGTHSSPLPPNSVV